MAKKFIRICLVGFKIRGWYQSEKPRLAILATKPLFPFIWYRVALPRVHPELLVEEFEKLPNKV